MEKPNTTNNPEAIPQQASAPVKTESTHQPIVVPVNNSALPNKNAIAPEYRQCMASDPRITEEVINGILARGVNKKD